MIQNGSVTYTYDAESRIKTAGGVTYAYDKPYENGSRASRGKSSISSAKR